MAYSGSWLARPAVRRVGAVAAALALCGAEAQAGEPEAQAPPRVEMWSGGQAFRHVWSVYGGATVAPFGAVRDDGFRLRGVLGYADYGDGHLDVRRPADRIS